MYVLPIHYHWLLRYFTTDHAEEVLFHLFIITISESEKSVNIKLIYQW